MYNFMVIVQWPAVHIEFLLFCDLQRPLACAHAHTCQPTEFKNRETSKNLQGQPAEPCQQQQRASEGCGIGAIFRPSVGGGGGDFAVLP